MIAANGANEAYQNELSRSEIYCSSEQLHVTHDSTSQKHLNAAGFQMHFLKKTLLRASLLMW